MSEGERHGHTYAAGVIEARLGRGAQDVLEAAVVLEAWGGVQAGRALSLGARVVPPEPAHVRPGRLDVEDSGQRESILGEAIALLLAIVAVASWAGPLGRQVGFDALERAILIALPVTLALQWALRSRYLSRRAGMACLRRDRLAVAGLALLAVEAPLALLVASGPLAALLVAIWVAGTVLARRGWALPYGLLLLGALWALQADLPAYPLLGALAAAVLAAAVAAVATAREGDGDPAGRLGRALCAGAMGGALGGMLVGDPTLGWGVHGAFPGLALVPSMLGSFWGGLYLWRLYAAIPRGLQGVPLRHANRLEPRGAAMRVFLGALARLIVATAVLSGALMLAASLISGTDRPSLFLAFGCVALVTMLINVLESLSCVRWALAAAIAALAAELALGRLALAHGTLPGAALIAGAAVGILVALPPLVLLLLRPGRALATSLWIK